MRPLVEREHIEYALQRHNLGQFQKLNAEWQSICQRVKATIPGSEQEKSRRIKDRVFRFFASYSQINLEQPQYPRNDVNFLNPFLQVCQNSLVIYGCDLMSTRRVQGYFGSFLVDIEWLNDSHCKVTFKDRQTAIQAIIANSVFEAKQYLKSHNRSIEDFQKQWFQLNPYYELCFKRKLMARFATNLDVPQSSVHNKKRVFYDYSIAKREFIKNANPQHSHNDPRSRSRSHSRSNSRSSQRSHSFRKSKINYQRNQDNLYKQSQFNRYRSRQKKQYDIRNFQHQLKFKSPVRTNYHSNWNFDKGYNKKRERQGSSIDSSENRQIRQTQTRFMKYIQERNRTGKHKGKYNNDRIINKEHTTNRVEAPSFFVKGTMEQEEMTIKDFERYMKGITLDESNLSEFDVTDGNINMLPSRSSLMRQ